MSGDPGRCIENCSSYANLIKALTVLGEKVYNTIKKICMSGQEKKICHQKSYKALFLQVEIVDEWTGSSRTF